MPQQPPPPSPKPSIGRRQLAAILFTDVVSFSALAEKNEKLTLLLVQRDLKLISDICHQHEGEVLKNTGDGCLATFSSVESAVRSALKMQGIFTEAAARLPPEKVLHHRIGIHLGDVFLGQGDVLGNGVNIAARLLGEAEPDGICISQAVYDVVKHRLGVKAVCIGARELKNIREAMPVYRLLLGAAAEESGDTPNASAARQPSASSHRRRRTAILLTATLCVVGAAVGVVATSVYRSHRGSQQQAAAMSQDPFAQTLAHPAPTSAPAILSTSQPATTTSGVDPLQFIQHNTPDFAADSAGSWNTFPKTENENLHCSVENGRYVMVNASENMGARMSLPPWGSFNGDCLIEATAQLQGQPLSSWGVALVSTQGQRRFARVSVTGAGLARIDLSRMNGFEATTRSTPESIQLFPDATNVRHGGVNTLLLDIHDHKLTVFLNHKPLPAQSADLAPLGPIYIEPTIGGPNGTRADFEHFKIWVPSATPGGKAR